MECQACRQSRSIGRTSSKLHYIQATGRKSRRYAACFLVARHPCHLRSALQALRDGAVFSLAGIS